MQVYPPDNRSPQEHAQEIAEWHIWFMENQERLGDSSDNYGFLRNQIRVAYDTIWDDQEAEEFWLPCVRKLADLVNFVVTNSNNFDDAFLPERGSYEDNNEWHGRYVGGWYAYYQAQALIRHWESAWGNDEIPEESVFEQE